MRIKRVLSLILLAVCVIVALPLGCRMSLVRRQNELDKVFRSGVDGDGYSIQSDLDIVCTNAGSILSVAGRFISDDDEAYSAAFKAYEQMCTADTIGEKSAAFRRLTLETEALYRKLKDITELSATDLRLIKQCEGEIQSRTITINSNGYNELAEKFNSSLRVFPANLIAPLVGISASELF